jgi:phage terminase large subunit-like protein
MPDGFDDWPDAVKKYFIDELHKKIPKPPRAWYSMARPKQLPPDNPRHATADHNGYRCRWVDKEGVEHLCQGQKDWFVWLFMAGRGCGKTLAGANWVIEQALTYPGTRWAVVAPTYDQVQNVCFAAVDSGIRAQAQPGEIVDYNKNNMLLTMSNGSEIKGFSAENPERIRGYNLAGAWLDEVGSYRYRTIWDEVLQPALRKGDPRVIVTTTPSASPLLKEWYERWLEHAKRGEQCDIHLTAAIFKENDTLPPRRVEELERQYGGTRIGRQELEGEMLEDFEGALWKREFIENHRVRESDFFNSNGKLKTELFSRVVVAVDPSMTAGERADESGIVVAGQGIDNEAYIIADWSVQGTPEAVMGRAVAAYYEFYADCVVMEANQGGDYLTKALKAADPNVPPRIVRASKGKAIRAQPVSMLAEQGRLHHIGHQQKLEDQLCMLTPIVDTNHHDDRADAMIWAVSELRGITDGSYLEAYGFTYCNSCGHAFRKVYKKCPKCGHELDPDIESKTLRPGSWAAAYMNTCKKCGTNFTVREKECPNCHPTPTTYMAQVNRAKGNQNWMQYAEKNWFQGKKF